MAAQEIEDFYGVYLLYNLNPKFKGRTYIGFTVNPVRRIKQHNRGQHAGGAKRTDQKGPWEMILIVHGFPNEISALRFEWAWTYPQKSRRLRSVVGKRKKELLYDFKFRILSEMLRVGPWKRLSLTIRWLNQEYQRDFAPELAPPVHMAVAYGPVRIKKVKETGTTKTNTHQTEDDFPQLTTTNSRCAVCFKKIQTEENVVSCVHRRCTMVSHIICLSKHFLADDTGEGEHGQLMPVAGKCPKCKQSILWGDVIRHKNGCYHNLEEYEEAESSDDDHWANQLQNENE